MVYGSKRLCLTSSLERPFRCLDFSILLIWLTWYWGLPSQWGARCSTRWGCRPSSLPTPASSTPSIWSVSVSEIFHLFPKLDASNSSFFFLRSLAFLFYGMRCPQYWQEQTRFLPMCQAVCTNTPNISPPCQNEGHQYTLSAIQELISSWKHQSKSSQERHLSFCQNWSFWRIFYIGMFSNLCC